MKSQFVNDLNVGQELLDELLLLKDMVRRTTKDGRPYLLCTLGDKTGQMAGVFWDLPTNIDKWIQPGLVLYVTGKVVKYKDSLQINVSDAYPHDSPNLADFLPSSARTQEEMVQELKQKIEKLREPYQKLLTHILLEPSFLNEFSNAPAAKTMHHAHIGGLLEHSLSMATIAEYLANHYHQVDQDLLMAGALLHDLGKVVEYTFKGSFSVSDDGRMVGHIVRAAIIVENAASEIENISEDQVRNLIHLILSHHGTQEWGSPVTPKTLEAVLLHQIDLLDSRVHGFYDHLNNDSGDSAWTSKPSPMHGTYLKRFNDS